MDATRLDATRWRLLSLATLGALLGACAARGTPMAGCLPGVPSPAPQLRLAAASDGARADGAGSITIVARQLVDGRPLLDHAVIVLIGADSAPVSRAVDRAGSWSARRPGGEYRVQVRAVGFEAVETLLRVRADFTDTLVATLRPSPSCVQGEFLRVRQTADGERLPMVRIAI